jgi:hypothetical protein
VKYLTFIVCLILASCSEPAGSPFKHLQGIRPGFIELNQTMMAVCEQAQIECAMVNVGKVENDGTGDLISVAVAKIAGNFLALKSRLPPVEPTPAQIRQKEECFIRGDDDGTHELIMICPTPRLLSPL